MADKSDIRNQILRMSGECTSTYKYEHDLLLRLLHAQSTCSLGLVRDRAPNWSVLGRAHHERIDFCLDTPTRDAPDFEAFRPTTRMPNVFYSPPPLTRKGANAFTENRVFWRRHKNWSITTTNNEEIIHCNRALNGVSDKCALCANLVSPLLLAGFIPRQACPVASPIAQWQQ